MEVRVGDVKKWVGREQSHVLDEPWPAAVQERLEWPLESDRPRGTVTVRNTGERLLVTVEGTAHVRAVCARCLEPFLLEVRFEESQAYQEAVPLPEDDWLAYHGDIISLDDMVADAVGLALPMAPVCRADCAGLCPVCGQNRNQTACDCVVETDERWADLRVWTHRVSDES